LTWRRLLLGRNDDEPTANELLMGEEARGSDDDGGGRSEVTAEYADRRHGSEERWTARRTRPRIVAEEFKHSAVFLANDTNNFVVAALAATSAQQKKRKCTPRPFC
jgi:hypothetical protein